MGTLYLVSTPIGNLEDITLRALKVLAEVELIAAEDTRHSAKLLKHHAIDTSQISYHEHSKPERLGELVERLETGSLALISDAGTPGLSDPGYVLVRAALDAGHQVSPIPGPSAPLAALVASGLPTDAFHFVGFLPRKAVDRRRLLAELAGQTATLVAFEAPHRLAASLSDLREAFGDGRQAVVCRELTKLYEQMHRGSLSELQAEFEAEAARGEITLVVAGAGPPAAWDRDRVEQAMRKRMSEGLRRSEAARQVAAEAGWPRRQVYRLVEDEQ